MNKINGVAVGTVVDVDAVLARVRVRLPTLGEDSHWAPIATPMAGADRGIYCMPEVGDEVLLAFEQGAFDHPFVVGFLWNGMDAPPRNDAQRRVIRSVNGHEIELYDPGVSGGDKGYIRIKDAHGNFIELANARITIQSVAAINIQAPSVVINGRPVVPSSGTI